METPKPLLQLQPVQGGIAPVATETSQFIIANTREVTVPELKHTCVIPAFAKDLESTIAHTDFIESVGEAVENFFQGELISRPMVRVSHPIKGRIPEAKGKPAQLLEDDEKTLYWERMMFIYTVPSIFEEISGNTVQLSIGGVRSYSETNLYGKKGMERIKLFIGFQNKVCTNLCVSTDGVKLDVRVRSIAELMEDTFNLVERFNVMDQIRLYKQLPERQISETQFAQVLGRIKMFPFLENPTGIPDLSLNDSQVSQIIREFYQDPNFGNPKGGAIDLWRLYNLLTGANKGSYIDKFLDRAVAIQAFTEHLRTHLDSPRESWYLSGVL